MQYKNINLTELREIAKEKGVKSVTTYKKDKLIEMLENIKPNIASTSNQNSLTPNKLNPNVKKKNTSYLDELNSGIEKSGILEVLSDGYGFLRTENYLSSENDIYVSPAQIRRFNLRTGDFITGNLRIPKDNEKFSALLFLSKINDEDANEVVKIKRKSFESLTPIYPNEKLCLENESNTISSRIIDIISPIGKGQRGMIVAPPKTGKTTLLKSIANSIKQNYKDIYLLVLLIDERPEEVTDMMRSIKGNRVEVVYSTFDEQPEHHKRVAEMVLERGKRLAEMKKDVVILLDSITRLSRAYNILTPSSGRTLSGGLDPATLYMPKKFFGAARNIEEGGSLTILATALIDTGSKMDDVIFEEFKGTGNMELVLDRKLAERRIFPSIDLVKSSTRKDELLINDKVLEASYHIRKHFTNNYIQNIEATQKIFNTLKSSNSNSEFISNILNKSN